MEFVDRKLHSEPSFARTDSSVISESGDASPYPDDDIPSGAYRVLHRLAGKWTDVLDEKNLVLTPVKGAMTNHVYDCHWPQEGEERPRRVLVRVYGEGSAMFFKREDEIRTFERMSKLGQGPRLLGRFPNGRVEQFLNARTLRASDLRNPAISARIAEKLSQFHKLDIPGPCKPQLWERLRFWLGKALELCSPICHEEFHLHTMMEEISELEIRFSKRKERTGFCHNDLQYGNIMMDETHGSVTIIDYEYASFNPVAFDIANHFCEMTADYHTETPHVLDFSKYPDYAERLRFIEAYLQASEPSVSSVEVEELEKDVECYKVASHLHWALWGILSATFSDIDFNYLAYAQQRFQLYYQSKSLLQ